MVHIGDTFFELEDVVDGEGTINFVDDIYNGTYDVYAQIDDMVSNVVQLVVGCWAALGGNDQGDGAVLGGDGGAILGP